MTWEEVCQYVIVGSRVLERGRESMVISYGSEDQRLRVELVRAYGEPWVLFLSPVVQETKAHLRDALTLNMKLAIGALALEQGYLVMRATFPLAALDRAALDRHVEFVAAEAIRLRRLHGGLIDPGPGELFRD